MQLIQLSAIRTDGGTQMRVELSQTVYMDYRDKWLAGEELPPVDVFYDGASYWLADGFHRFYGAREAKRHDIPANVHQGTQRDARLFACGVNDNHGFQRTPADKRLAVMTLIADEEWSKWSDRKLAEVAKVSKTLVNDMRNQLSVTDSSPSVRAKSAPRMGKDGKVRRPPMRKPTPPPAAPASPPTAGKPEPLSGPPAPPPPPKPRPQPSAPGESQFVREFLALWGRCDDVAKAAIRAIVLEDAS